MRGALRGAAVALGVAWGATTVAQPTPEEAAIVQARAAALPLERGVEAVELYQPAETVRGAGPTVTPLPTAEPRRAGIDPEALAEAVRLAERHRSHALLVARHGRLVLERYWNGFDRQSRFSTASMHKGVLSLLVGVAVGEGRLAEDDPLARYLPEWRRDPRGRVRIAHLLDMASGLAWPPDAPRPPSPTSPNLRLMFAPDIRKVALEVPKAAEPGTVFAYSNTDSQLLAEALQSALAVRYARFLSERIWRPIGAADATLFLDRPGGSVHGLCCLQAAPMDWVRLGELVRRKGRWAGRQLVPASWIDRLARPSALNPNFSRQWWRGHPHAPQRRYGPAIALTVPAAEPFLAADVLFLDGSGGQRLYVIPSAGLVIVRIGAVALDWDDSQLPNILLRGLQPARG
ncbi:MAG: beta-lactamase family protein [Sphingomonadaceae bacterium]|uniref:serine hydrolase domain-containing protein n=1 Tax=Thermaurantiacus sp. TaxID=2820283 RepID=UPI00298F1EB4|nr:serine hydrolase [Thermaurantiacus sp.]MCS6987564.1 beta-lactamase family protein [Sphingomonadaceae bacterium]MDW8415165.1 serine hydrolase [Thermaurantiacus sp.]